MAPEPASGPLAESSPAPGLRERRRREVRAELERAAVLLAAEHGYHAVTTEQVAAAAGVSHRTLFRHVGSKEELVLGGLLRGGRAIVHHLESRPDDEPVDAALQQAILARIEEFDVDEAGVAAWRTVVLGTPELVARVSLISAADRERLVELVADRLPARPDRADTAALLVAVVLAAAQQAFAGWLHGGAGSATLTVQTERAFRFLQSWPWAQ